MDLSIQGKIAVITGGSRGIGKSIAKSLALEGVVVCVVARNQEDIRSTCVEIEAGGGKALGISCDVTKFVEVENVVQKIINKFGAIDFLINNAGGVNKFGSFQECSEEDWISAFQLNVMSCVNLVRACEQALLRSTQARIITISSIVGLQPGMYNPHYSAVKAATINLSKHFANIYADRGVLCNSICVGPVHSDSWTKNVISLSKKKGVSFEEAFNELELNEKIKIPLGRVGEGRDISSMVAFLLSENASWITGTCVHVSGGKFAGMS